MVARKTTIAFSEYCSEYKRVLRMKLECTLRIYYLHIEWASKGIFGASILNIVFINISGAKAQYTLFPKYPFIYSLPFLTISEYLSALLNQVFSRGFGKIWLDLVIT